jgi:hypothetical protein
VKGLQSVEAILGESTVTQQSNQKRSSFSLPSSNAFSSEFSSNKRRPRSLEANLFHH